VFYIAANMGEVVKIEGVAVSLSNFPQFDVEDEFTIFQERFENQLDVCGVAEQTKAGLLIASISANVYKVLKSLCDPDLPKTKTYVELIALLQSHFVARISIFKERRTFYQAAQTKKETVNDWYLRIKGLAVNCAFGNDLTTILKDRFVSGLVSGPVFDRIAEEEPTISLEDVVNIAVTKDDYVRQNRPPPPQPKEAKEPKAPKQPKPRNEPAAPAACSAPPSYPMSQMHFADNPKANPTLHVCRACGKPNHDFANCKFKKFKCNNCQQVGHTVSVCKFPQKK